jgi:bifunctional DNA-binding transcriptional regulator/antitoxin component of YhaV-PrlF toxin-antitoxin module
MCRQLTPWNRSKLIRRKFTLAGKAFSPYIWFMSTLTVTAKGQITLRKDLLKHLGVETGGKLAVEKLPDGRIGIRAERPAGKISDVFNALKHPDGSCISIEEMNEIAARGWAEEL